MIDGVLQAPPLAVRKKAHCPFCGDRLGHRVVENRRRLFCDRCDTPIYENPVPAACLIVTDVSGRLLLVKRSVDPKKGFWCLPGGFMELGESPDASALRELKEETGLEGEIHRLFDVISHPNPFYDTVLIICYTVSRFSGEPVAGDDASDARFFFFHSLPEIAFKSHERLIHQFFDNGTGR